MRHRVWAAVCNDLRSWGHHLGAWACLGIAVAVLELSLARPPASSVFRQVLGGPTAAVLGHQLRLAPGWTWFLEGALFVVPATILADTPSAWTRLTLVRGVSRGQWAIARLAALGAGALSYLTVLVAAMAVALLLGHAGPLVRVHTLWDVGLWAVGLVSLGWFALALKLTTGQGWTAFAAPLMMLALARYGGNLSPYVPFAQWMVALHGLYGTLSIAAGAAYLVAWTLLSGAAAVWAAEARLPQREGPS